MRAWPALARCVGRSRNHWLVRLIALLVVIAGYAFVSLAPFRWSPPHLVENGAEWTGRPSLDLPRPGLVVGPSKPDWLSRAAESGDLTLELRIRPLVLGGRGNILTIGGRDWRDNLHVQQVGRNLIIRLTRTCRHIEVLELPCTTGRRFQGVFEAGRWVDLELSVKPGAMAVTVNGERVMERALTDRPLVVWDLGQRLALGNAPTGDWPWQGEIGRALVRTGGVTTDLLDPDAYVRPDTFWLFDHHPRLVPFDGAPPKDMLHNAVMYVPFGALLALLGFWGGWRGVAYALLATAMVSLAMETTQLFLSKREPSTTDLLLNAAGGGFGYMLVETIRTDPRVRRLISRERCPWLRAREQQS